MINLSKPGFFSSFAAKGGDCETFFEKIVSEAIRLIDFACYLEYGAPVKAAHKISQPAFSNR